MGCVVTLLIFSDCCRVRKIPPPPFPPILRLYSPSLNIFPGLLLELGSSISKVSGNTFSNSEAFLKSCRLAGVVVAELLLSFVFEIRRYGRLQPSRCQSQQQPLSVFLPVSGIPSLSVPIRLCHRHSDLSPLQLAPS